MNLSLMLDRYKENPDVMELLREHYLLLRLLGASTAPLTRGFIPDMDTSVSGGRHAASTNGFKAY